ncbi:NAD(P)-binding protein [Neolentinus lepideus HHB14362 ss-1]|uniref:NAD(P)-binding protein n=1 Tax=Neolentinus lepideus HHB14362 ss-1 TaxID=1314782 RepID=A0A165NN14_9AGAM|nr:NAD(P)-binding protein [Neolentinus lepideus HHB14362 ss-1]
MSGYKNFVIAGAGRIGYFIVEELLKLQSSGTVSAVTVLTRVSLCVIGFSIPLIDAGTIQSGGYADLAEKGVKVVAVDYSPSSSSVLVSALQGTDVVISTLGGGAIDAQQIALADAAKQAGVSLFVPSEFGNPTEGATEGILGTKNRIHRHLEKIGLPYALFHTGLFTDYVFSPFLGWDLPNGKVFIRGEGNAPISFTHRRDIGRFVAYVLIQLQRDQLHWKVFAIEGDRKSWNDVLELYQAKTGKTLQVTHQPRSELQTAFQKNPQDFVAYISLAWDEGRGIVGKPEELSNKLFPSFNPSNIIDTILETQ